MEGEGPASRPVRFFPSERGCYNHCAVGSVSPTAGLDAKINCHFLAWSSVCEVQPPAAYRPLLTLTNKAAKLFTSRAVRELIALPLREGQCVNVVWCYSSSPFEGQCVSVVWCYSSSPFEGQCVTVVWCNTLCYRSSPHLIAHSINTRHSRRNVANCSASSRQHLDSCG